MSGAFCPACGVAVVPGYVKCPKCHRPLPRFARNSISPVGGTVVAEKTKSWPIVAILLGIVVVVFIGWQVKSAFEDYRNKSLRTVHRDAAVAVDDQPRPPPPTINDSIVAGQPVSQQPTVPRVRAEDVAKDLEHNLKRQRLWSNVTVIGDRVEIRSASCADGGMKPTIETAVAAFHAAGLTKLRCLEQSGGVVFSRDL